MKMNTEMTRLSKLTANPTNKFDLDSLTFAEIGLFNFVFYQDNRTAEVSRVLNATSDCELTTFNIIESLIAKNAITVS